MSREQYAMLEFFLREVKSKGKYEIVIEGNQAYIIPRMEERFYKPIVRIRDLNSFAVLLIEYVEAMCEFYERKGLKKKDYQSLSYLFNIMLFNLAPSDAEDLNKYMEMRISFFRDSNLEEFVNAREIFAYEDVSFYAQREVEEIGLETPYIMVFTMLREGKIYNLPLIRYGISENRVCHIYAVQIGRGRAIHDFDEYCKRVINGLNKGIKEFRGVAPSFVLALAMFIKMLSERNINKIVIPDFLFNRYKKYYGANTTVRSDEILERMMKSMATLVKRLDNEINGFDIRSYPLDGDSYYHIEIDRLASKNMVLKALFERDKNEKRSSN